MRRQMLTGVAMLATMTVLLGIVYPLAVTAAAQLAFPHQAGGSVVEVGGTPVGSELIGQPFTGLEWFHPRPSAAAGGSYDAMGSSGSNLGPTSPELLDAVEARVDAYRSGNGLPPGATVPGDAVTSSASGLDPHISVANARLQASRVAASRGLDPATVLGLVEAYTERRPLSVLGDPGVNVLLLNLALEEIRGAG
jgi:K+-transporting ATPase ATPase C chain